MIQLFISRVFVLVSNVYTCGSSRYVRPKISSIDGELSTSNSLQFPPTENVDRINNIFNSDHNQLIWPGATE